ncbi:MAG: dihydroorotase, partial [Saprospiraceae bacterium]|nr:dihydroorotase [Saprospiraceae bacterium]
IKTESRAAVAGGITSYMEMPNVIPQTLTQELLEAKYQLGASRSLANYSFYMGTSNDNIDEILRTNPKLVCGVKIFMGSSTGDMLVDKESTLENVFRNSPLLIATHCEDEGTIKSNQERAMKEYGDEIPFNQHPIIRNEDACYLSSSKAVDIAKKNNTRLHILHISTAKELSLFDGSLPIENKRITSEACIHHLWFANEDYARYGSRIKWNPAVKKASDRKALWDAIKNDQIDVIATDHAPHTLEEKDNVYTKSASGGPLVQHALVALLEAFKQDKISLERIVEKTSHAVAKCFQIAERGFIREGYFADCVLVDLSCEWKVEKENILYKCGWSPFENQIFHSSIRKTFVSGHLAYDEGILDDSQMGLRMTFNRN